MFWSINVCITEWALGGGVDNSQEVLMRRFTFVNYFCKGDSGVKRKVFQGRR